MMAVWASPNVKDRLNEERNEVKVSRSVLESSGSRKGVADFNLFEFSHLPPGRYNEKLLPKEVLM